MHILWDIIWKVLFAALIGMLLALLLIWWGPPIYGITFGEAGEYINFNSVTQKDGNYYLLGSRAQRGFPRDNNSYLLKLDETGEKLWDKDFSTIGQNKFYKIEKTTDDNLLVAGYSSKQNINNAYVSKLNSNGEQNWELALNEEKNSLFYDLIELDNSYLLLGVSNNLANKNEVLLLEVDTDGNQTTAKRYTRGQGLKLKSIQRINDEFIIAGTYWDDNYQRHGYYAILDENLEIINEVKVVEPGYSLQIEDFIYDDDEIVLVGTARAKDMEGSSSSKVSGYLAKYERSGDEIWSLLKREGDKYYQFAGVDIVNQQIVVAGRRFEPSLHNTTAFSSQEMVQVMMDNSYAAMYDKQGQLIWEENYRGQESGGFVDVSNYDGESLLLVGELGKYRGERRGYLNRIDLEGNSLEFSKQKRDGLF